MPLTSQIEPYNPEWPRLYEAEAQRLAPVFEIGHAAFHHVGSTAVPGLASKPEIDLLVVTAGEVVGVRTSKALAGWATGRATTSRPDIVFSSATSMG